MESNTKTALNWLSTSIVIAVAISSVAGAYMVYKNNFWRPKINVDGVDYSNGIAQLIINGKKKVLYNGSTVWAGGDWGVRFNTDAAGKLSRLEVTKGGLVHETIFTKN